MKIIKEPFMQLQPEHFISVTFETEVKDADSVRELIEKCAKNVLERENIPFDAEIDDIADALPVVHMPVPLATPATAHSC